MTRKRLRLPLFALIILPSLVGVLLISIISWRLFDPAVERSSEVALSVMEDMIKTTGSESLRYPLAVGDTAGVKRIVAAMASNDLVFAVQVEDAEGELVARSQNENLPIGEGIRLIEYREKLFIEAIDDENFLVAASGKTIYVGEALYQLSPHVLTVEKDRLIGEYRFMIGALVAIGLVVILLASRILWKSARSITLAMRRIAAGDSGVRVETDTFVSEFEVITRGVNRLSENVDEARQRQKEALEEVEQSAEQARQSDRETRSFYEMATREIANPVMQVVELLKMNQSGDAPPVDPDVILDSAERVKLSVLAMLGKLSEDRGDEAENEIELGDYFEWLAAHYRPRFERKNLAFRVEPKGGTEYAKYKIDARTLEIVLEKLLENALKYTPDGEVRVHWSVLEARDGEHELKIVVRDNGIGIDAANLEAIFDRYSHFEPEAGATPGSGLGLYIARELISRQGGSLMVKSQAGVGSEFTVKVPITRGDRLRHAQLEAKGKIALIVGAGDRDRLFIEEQLAHREMVCLHADTAIEALGLLVEHQIDLILVDDSVEDIDVESFISEAGKRQDNCLRAVLGEEGVHYDGDFPTVTKPISKQAMTELIRKMTTERKAGVDYGLIERLNARRDREGD